MSLANDKKLPKNIEEKCMNIQILRTNVCTLKRNGKRVNRLNIVRFFFRCLYFYCDIKVLFVRITRKKNITKLEVRS